MAHHTSSITDVHDTSQRGTDLNQSESSASPSLRDHTLIQSSGDLRGRQPPDDRSTSFSSTLNSSQFSHQHQQTHSMQQYNHGESFAPLAGGQYNQPRLHVQGSTISRGQTPNSSSHLTSGLGHHLGPVMYQQQRASSWSGQSPASTNCGPD